jgi:predicted methyltransferase
MQPDLPLNPTVELVKTPNGEVTLAINGGQAMQAWERELMHLSADWLCSFGSQFLEVGLGLGLSALRIASDPRTVSHRVVELYPQVTELFLRQHAALPTTLEIVHADIFSYAHMLEPESFDGIFFDPALPEPLWDDMDLWNQFMPTLLRALRPGGAFIPFFSTTPVLRKQYVQHFQRVVVERHTYTAYPTTHYTSAIAGEAYIQCFIQEGGTGSTRSHRFHK